MKRTCLASKTELNKHIFHSSQIIETNITTDKIWSNDHHLSKNVFRQYHFKILYNSCLKISLTFLILISFLTISSAQYKTISGTVINAITNNPIPNVRVEVNGTLTFTTSNSSGNFILSIPDSIEKITFAEFSGFETMEIQQKNESSIEIYLASNNYSNMTLEEMMNVKVSNISFFKMSSKQAPSYTYQLNMDDVKNGSARTLEQILNQYAPGITVSRHQRHGSLIGTRGLSIDNNAKTLVLLDGININQRTHYGYTIGLQSSLLGDIQDIDIINGPSAITLGSGAINGFVNMKIKNGSDNTGFNTEVEYGLREYFSKIELGYGFKYGNNKDLYFYAGMANSEGFKADSTFGTDPATFPSLSQIQRDSILNFKSYGYKLPSKKLSVNWRHNKFKINAMYLDMTPANNSYSDVGWWHWGMLAIHPRFATQISKKEELEIIGATEFYENNFIREIPYLGNKLFGGGTEEHYGLKAIIRSQRIKYNQIAFGTSADYRNFRGPNSFFDTDPASMFVMSPTHWTESSIFLEDIYDFSKSIKISAGLRYDFTKFTKINGVLPDNVSHLSPRLASSFQLSNNTTLKVSFQNSFRYPDNAYFFWFVKANNALKSAGSNEQLNLTSESINSHEINFQHYNKNLNLSVNTNFFFNQYKNTLAFIYFANNGNAIQNDYLSSDAVDIVVNATQNQNVGAFQNTKKEFKSIGGELIIKYEPTSHLKTELVYSYAKLINAEGIIKERYPTHLLKINSFYTFFNNKLFANAGFSYNPGYDIQNLQIAPIFESPRTYVNLKIGYNIRPGVIIDLNAMNLTQNKVPVNGFFGHRPYEGLLGGDARFIYLSLRLNYK